MFSGCLSDVEEALKLVKGTDNLFTTIGCHPTRCTEFEDSAKSPSPDSYYESLAELIKTNREKVSFA